MPKNYKFFPRFWNGLNLRQKTAENWKNSNTQKRILKIDKSDDPQEGIQLF